ncbi:coproporphyrinogen III oxidase, anaerobic [Clostridium sp. USBA 49]|jgi:oxygen-independent coproporphyrinogen-3 oxidase|nr:coproporphyrinogen III oxidase, anaerobic [Clostridium sp. USBA 49]
MIKVYLNDMKFRYEVFQIINLYYTLENIVFVDEEGDINIIIDDKKIIISSYNNKFEFIKDYKLTSKESINLALFSFLKNATNKEFPWGTLIGIRPSKIALSLIQNGKTEEEIIKYYKEHYNTKLNKAKLCIDIAKSEEKFINKDSNTISIYIGMPFCPTRCLYCSFTSNPISRCNKLVNPYLVALKKEISTIINFIKEKNLKIQCVYFGGGTPTSINDYEFYDIMEFIYDNLINKMDIQEFTVECGRPDSITENKLKTMKKFEVDRISINPQTMNDDTLKKIGRNHTSLDVVDKFNLARELGFSNINMDIIVGLMGEKLEHINKTCKKIKELNPDSITVHGLSIKRASKLHENLINKNKLEELSQKEINDMYEETVLLANDLNMKPYYMYRQKNMFGNMENIGYAKQRKESIYNIQMIEEKQSIIAFGADAVSKIVFLDENRIERFANIKDVNEYINRIDEMINKKINLLKSLYN